MPYLLDTVTLSELRKRSKVAAGVIAWQESAAGQQAHVSVITMSEIRFHDSLIAATAKIHGLTLATRNLADFEPTGIDLLNPRNYRD
jgi:predicted nucleic acid-binding protein